MSLVQDQHGHSGPCHYIAGNYRTTEIPIEQRWMHEDAEFLRREFLAGKKPAACERCWKEEKHGARSARIMNLLLYPDVEERIKAGDLKYERGAGLLVIRVSNFCNLACRTCRSSDSSKFAAEGKFYAAEYGLSFNIYEPTESRREWTEEEFLRLLPLAHNLRRVDFFGGEPMINQTHHALLRALVERNLARDIELFYCTNGTHYPSDERLALWDKFRRVTWAISLDEIGDRYHYVRWPGSWKTVEGNFQRLRNEAARLGCEMNFRVNTTVSALNVFHLPEIYDWISANVGDAVMHTLVHAPSYYSVVNLPEEAKRPIAEKLMRSDHFHKVGDVIRFMYSKKCDPEQWGEFLRWTGRKDRFRKVKFADYLPEYYGLLRGEFDGRYGG